jgi:hypothetical protein
MRIIVLGIDAESSAGIQGRNGSNAEVIQTVSDGFFPSIGFEAQL